MVIRRITPGRAFMSMSPDTAGNGIVHSASGRGALIFFDSIKIRDNFNLPDYIKRLADLGDFQNVKQPLFVSAAVVLGKYMRNAIDVTGPLGEKMIKAQRPQDILETRSTCSSSILKICR